MDYKEVLGFLAAILTNVCFLPQAFQIYKTKDAKAISLGMYILFCSGVFLWTIYGFFLKSLPMVISSVITLVFALAILMMKIRYK